MKYKVLLIDDEPIIRKGLKNIIKWEQYNCEVCGEASNGYEGINMIEKHKPHIVFTDIRMPEMTGLEMLEELQDVCKDIKVIILTGFRDFDYVKEALMLGAFDFLLKPTKLNDIKKVVDRAVKQLDMVKNTSQLIDKLKKQFEDSIPKLKEKFLYEIMMGIMTDPDEILVRSERLGIELDEFFTIIASVEDSSTQNEQFMQYGTLHTFEEILSEDYEIYSVAINDHESAFVIKKDASKEMEMFYTRCTELQRMIKKSFNMSMCISISNCGNGLNDIFMCYNQCKRANDYKYVMGDDAFILYSDISKNKVNHADKRLKAIGQFITTSITNGSGTLSDKYINNLITEIKKRDVSDNDIKPILDTIIKDILEIMPDACYQPKKNADIDDLLKDIKRLLCESKSASMQVDHNNMRLILKKAIGYLERNYQSHITLEQVANAVFVSPYYISRMFTRETGKTMTEYLNDMRMKNACILLEDVEFKVYQVGEMVGIPDAHYFSRIFKKSIGLTPSEYRNRLINKTE